MAGADPAWMSATAGQGAGKQVGDNMMREAGFISVSAWDAQKRSKTVQPLISSVSRIQSPCRSAMDAAKQDIEMCRTDCVRLLFLSLLILP